jgi:hypothetical protein
LLEPIMAYMAQRGATICDAIRSRALDPPKPDRPE